MKRVALQDAFVLHRRPLRDTSYIVEFFTKEHGRVAAVARSARGPKSRYRGRLEPFVCMQISYAGRNELKHLGAVEFAHMPALWQGDRLACGFYLNELLMRLLPHEDPYQQLFEDYATTLAQLETATAVEPILRFFEKRLLIELGYGIPLLTIGDQKEPIQPKCYYRYIPDKGFIPCQPCPEDVSVFKGQSLLDFHYDHCQQAESQLDAKRLMRMVLAHYLGDKPLRSRLLYAAHLAK